MHSALEPNAEQKRGQGFPHEKQEDRGYLNMHVMHLHLKVEKMTTYSARLYLFIIFN